MSDANDARGARRMGGGGTPRPDREPHGACGVLLRGLEAQPRDAPVLTEPEPITTQSSRDGHSPRGGRVSLDTSARGRTRSARPRGCQGNRGANTVTLPASIPLMIARTPVWVSTLKGASVWSAVISESM